ncbi:MAG: VOC family protein [Pseudomonadota bacterium]
MSDGNPVLRPFHLAFPVHDLGAARQFYVGLLGCSEGRSSESWIDFSLYGHQIVAHHDPAMESGNGGTNAVDGDAVPVFHFGVILKRADWDRLVQRLDAAGIEYLIRPRLRFAGQAGEQGTFFITDPSGNGLEFKCFADDRRIFATD